MYVAKQIKKWLSISLTFFILQYILVFLVYHHTPVAFVAPEITKFRFNFNPTRLNFFFVREKNI